MMKCLEIVPGKCEKDNVVLCVTGLGIVFHERAKIGFVELQ